MENEGKKAITFNPMLADAASTNVPTKHRTKVLNNFFFCPRS